MNVKMIDPELVKFKSKRVKAEFHPYEWRYHSTHFLDNKTLQLWYRKYKLGFYAYTFTNQPNAVFDLVEPSVTAGFICGEDILKNRFGITVRAE